MKLLRPDTHYLAWCGAIDLVTASPPWLQCVPSDFGGRASPRRGRNDEDAMTLKLPAANKLVVLLAAAAVTATAFGMTAASAQDTPA